MSSALEQSFKKRLQNIAKERSLTPAEVWQNVISERFLVRLCRSPYHSHFILKGGTLLAKHVKLGRETQDLDFSIKYLSNEARILQKVLEEIALIEINDGFTFANPTIEPLEHFHMQYPGAQAKIEVHFGQTRFPLFIDLGFGDVVTIQKKEIALLSNSKGPLFESSVILQCYPVEFIFAEKIETVIYRGSNNSRMKDFHDLFTLVCTESALNGKETEIAIKAVFCHRETPLLLPIQFEISQLKNLQSYWDRYHQTIAIPEQLPTQLSHVIDKINCWLIQETNWK